MPDLFYLIAKWWKQILAVVALSTAITGIIVFLKPSEYVSTTTALPGSSYATDKASVFNNNTQILYPALGTPEDLDMILGTAHLDTVYITVANRFGLADRYAVKDKGEAAVRKAAYILKDKTRVMKSEYNELKIKVWDGDKTFAPQLANAIMEKVQDIHQDIQNSHNVSLIKSLQTGVEKLQGNIDSINNYLKKALTDEGVNGPYNARRSTLLAQLQQYEKLLSEYQLLAENKPQVLIIVEKARVSDLPDRPKRLLILVATFVLSLLFSLAVIVLLEKRKSVKQ